MNWRLLRVFTFVLVMMACASAAQVSRRVTGIYSNMVFNREGGDVLGIEIFVLPSPKGYFVLFQSSEGAPAQPTLVPATVEGARIEFTLPPEASYSGTFSGTISPTEIVGSFTAGQLSPRGEEIIRLRRGNSYWQP